MAEPFAVEVRVTDEFERNLHTLSKKYRQILFDLQPTFDKLQAGEFIGAQIPGTNYTIFKVRVKNSDIQKGKSSGYRMIYQVITPTSVVIVTIYSKLDQEDISAKEIRDIVAEFNEDS
ncbi:MAG: type II toxin-antitoxin system RelE/ParE family toxin [Cyanobacteriota bacterium]